MLSRTVLVVVLFALALGGCSKGNGPAEELKSLFEVLGNPAISPSRLSAQVYSVLDEESRAAVDARAKLLGERLGTKVSPDEILQVRGLRSGARVTRVQALDGDTERATLEVSFAPIAFTSVPAGDAEAKAAEGDSDANKPLALPGAAPAARGEEATALAPLRIEVVRQSGKWRIAFPGLATLIGSQPLEPATTGGGR